MTAQNDALAALGLTSADEAAVTAAPAAADVAADAGDDAEKTAVADAAKEPAEERVPVNIGELEVGTIDFIPEMARTGGSFGARGSKYKFDELVAPVANAATGKTDYSFFRAKLQEGETEERLQRSIQSATTNANRDAKKAGTEAYFVTRTETKDGKFVGMLVVRTDARPAEVVKAA